MNIDEYREIHGNNLPTVRIHKVVIDNIKSVEHGEIEFCCAQKFVPYDTRPDILGLYGQNGSGKTSFIESLSMTKLLMMGYDLAPYYAENLAVGTESSKISITFDLQYEDGRVRKVVYEYEMRIKTLEERDIEKIKKEYYPEYFERHENKYKIEIFNERLLMAGDFYGKKIKLSPIIDTSVTGAVFGPVSKQKYFVNDKESMEELRYIKRLSLETSQSFIFSDNTMRVFENSELFSEYYQVIDELILFASVYFQIINARSNGEIRSGYSIPLYGSVGYTPIIINKPTEVSEEKYQTVKEKIERVDIVVSELIPGLHVKVNELSNVTLKDGKLGKIIELIASRNGVDLPLSGESDGVKKIIAITNLLIDAYNDCSKTVVIDELDAGVFEYLLGEILTTFEKSGKGQLIFTSHNLRPLEVINKDFLYFTTTNPKNRYIRLKGIGKTNNIRSMYFREILLGGQDEELYKGTKEYKIVAALRKAGEWDGQKTK